MKCILFAIAVISQSGDQLTDAINAVRAGAGLHALVYDANLAGWAAENNGQQAWRGMGHFVMGPASRQNAAWGSSTIQGVMSQWIGSAGHLAGFLDPTINASGGSFDGRFWTWNGGMVSPVSYQIPPPVTESAPLLPNSSPAYAAPKYEPQAVAPIKVVPQAQAPMKVLPQAQAPMKVMPQAQAPRKVMPAPQARVYAAPQVRVYAAPQYRTYAAPQAVRVRRPFFRFHLRLFNACSGGQCG